MADKVSFEMVSPDRLLTSMEVDMVIVPGTEGDFGVLPGHAPLISTLRPGVVEVHNEGEEVEKIFVRGGFAEVTPDGLTVLAEEAIPMAELDQAALAQEIQYAEEDLKDAKTGADRDKAQHRLDQVKQLMEVMN